MRLFGTEYGGLVDERLMELVVKGDERAFATLYDRYHRRLLGYFHRMLWNDRERAQDFLQDLFTKLATQPERYDRARPFQTWLFSVANNMCKNAYRHEAVVREAAMHLRHALRHHVQTREFLPQESVMLLHDVVRQCRRRQLGWIEIGDLVSVLLGFELLQNAFERDTAPFACLAQGASALAAEIDLEILEDSRASGTFGDEFAHRAVGGGGSGW